MTMDTPRGSDPAFICRVQPGWSDIHGIGAFATEFIAAGATIEECPVKLMPASAISPSYLDRSEFSPGDILRPLDHSTVWNNGGLAVATGCGMLYNHQDWPNAEREVDFESNTVRFVAVRDIEPGEEVTFHYGRWCREEYLRTGD